MMLNRICIVYVSLLLGLGASTCYILQRFIDLLYDHHVTSNFASSPHLPFSHHLPTCAFPSTHHLIKTMSSSPQDLLTSALHFLQDPTVATAPISRKIAFLKQKGLSEIDVDTVLAMSEEAKNKIIKEGKKHWILYIAMGLGIGLGGKWIWVLQSRMDGKNGKRLIYKGGIGMVE